MHFPTTRSLSLTAGKAKPQEGLAGLGKLLLFGAFRPGDQPEDHAAHQDARQVNPFAPHVVWPREATRTFRIKATRASPTKSCNLKEPPRRRSISMSSNSITTQRTRTEPMQATRPLGQVPLDDVEHVLDDEAHRPQRQPRRPNTRRMLRPKVKRWENRISSESSFWERKTRRISSSW